MEPSLFAHPAIIIFVAGGLVTFIAWLIRLESKASNTAERVDDAESAHEKLKTAFYAHDGSETKHHNAEAFKEFREGLNNRFSTIDSKLSEIKGLVMAKDK